MAPSVYLLGAAKGAATNHPHTFGLSPLPLARFAGAISHLISRYLALVSRYLAIGFR